MQTSEMVGELAAALAKAQATLEGASKDAANPQFNSKYADLSSVVAAIKGAFPANGLSYVQTVVTAEESVGVETLLMHSSGQWIKGDAFFVPVVKANAQGFGSALTYCRRYSLAAMCGVAPEDDDGNAATKAAPVAERVPQKPMSRKEFQEHVAAMDAATNVDTLQHAYTTAVMAARHINDGDAEKAFTEKKNILKGFINAVAESDRSLAEQA